MKIEKVSVAGINGKNVEVGHFSANYTSVFQLGNLSVESGEKYTLHGFVKASKESTITCFGSSKTIGTSWTEFAILFTASSETSIQLFFSPGEYWIYNWKLEAGDIITPWTPSPIDAKEDVKESTSEWKQTAEQIKSSVSKVSSDLSTAQSQWKQEADSISSSVSKVSSDLSTAQSSWKQSANELTTEISKKTDSETVKTIITANADSIRTKTGTIVWEAENSSMKEDGTFTCKDGNFTGDVNAKSITLGDGKQCKLLWGEAVPTYAWGGMASLGYYGGAGGAIHSLDIDAGGIALGSGTLDSDGQTVVANSQAIMGVEGLGTAFVTAPNGFYINGKLQSEYDWSEWQTENTTDTWVPVSTGSGKMQHRTIPSDEFTTQTSGIFRKRGKIVMVNFYGTSATSLPTVPSGYRPPSDISIPITVMYNGNPYMGYAQIRSGGSIQCTYYNYGAGHGTPASGSTIYGEATWIID